MFEEENEKQQESEELNQDGDVQELENNDQQEYEELDQDEDV